MRRSSEKKSVQQQQHKIPVTNFSHSFLRWTVSSGGPMGFVLSQHFFRFVLFILILHHLPSQTSFSVCVWNIPSPKRKKKCREKNAEREKNARQKETKQQSKAKIPHLCWCTNFVCTLYKSIRCDNNNDRKHRTCLLKSDTNTHFPFALHRQPNIVIELKC